MDMIRPGFLWTQVAFCLFAVLAADSNTIAYSQEVNEEVLSAISADELVQRFASEGSPLWADGEMLTAFYKGEADKVLVWIGGKPIPMARVDGSDVWMATQKLEHLDRGILNFRFTPMKDDKPLDVAKKEMSQWRGSKAPPAATLSKEIKGKIERHELKSEKLATGKREVYVYLPPEFEDTKKPVRVIYMTDGESVEQYAKALEPLISRGKVPPVAIVGVCNGGYLGELLPDYSNFDAMKDLRGAEYLTVLESEHFAGHATFFCDDVSAWAQKNYSVSDDREQCVILGQSNGARFAVTMGLERPEKFGHVIALSLAAGDPPTFAKPPELKADFYLAAGIWEANFHKLTTEFHTELEKSGFNSNFVSRISSHDTTMWQEEFQAAIVKIFGFDPTKRQQ